LVTFSSNSAALGSKAAEVPFLTVIEVRSARLLAERGRSNSDERGSARCDREKGRQ
jgi:hypothetical protein